MVDVKSLIGICYDCYDTAPDYIPRKQIRKFLERKFMVINPNGYMRFKSALGTETDIDVHVKISGPICIWLNNGTKLYLPNQDKMKEQNWFKEFVDKYGEYQGIFQRDTKIEMPDSEEKPNKLQW